MCCLFLLFFVGFVVGFFHWGNLFSLTGSFQLLTDHVSHLSGNAGKKKKKGWNSDDGRHLAITIAYESRHGFQLMILENVAPLLQDKPFRQRLDHILSHFGYRIISKTCINISTFQPVDRTRAIFLVCHETSQVHTGNCDEIVWNLLDDIPTSLWQRCRWLEIENPLREDAGIPCDALRQFCLNRMQVTPPRRITSDTAKDSTIFRQIMLIPI